MSVVESSDELNVLNIDRGWTCVTVVAYINSLTADRDSYSRHRLQSKSQ